jgi:diguanylate cyclase (GGDEF)-like protein
MEPSSRTGARIGRAESATAVLAAIEVGVLALDADAQAVYANPAWTELTGQPEGVWRGDGWQDLLPDLGDHRRRFLEAVTGGSAHGIEVQVRDVSPSRVLVLDVVAADDTGAATVVTARDITEERALEDSLSRAALRDPLTGLWNRSRFLDFLAVALAHAEREHDRRAAVFFVDVDGLKSVNDRHGHAAGDRLLRSVAEALTSAVRPGDVVARFGGDEFVVLCDDVHDGEPATIADRILTAIGASPDADCTVSVGSTVSLGATDDPSDIIARADADMYRQKRRSRQARPRAHAPSAGLAPVAAFGDEASELVWVLGAFVRLLRDRRETVDPAERDEVLEAIARVHARLEATLRDGAPPLDLAAP